MENSPDSFSDPPRNQGLFIIHTVMYGTEANPTGSCFEYMFLADDAIMGGWLSNL